ncbi:MAG: TIGR03619 family F420-dependent LLM class oxidoreductase [Acidimicrobiales bacterium]
MRFGYTSMNSASGIHPAVLAKELEARGFESMWVPEHAHIPTARTSTHPSGDTLPEGYLHMMNPFVSLAAAAAVTERLVVGTAVSLILQHDAIDLAVEAATLDVLSNGRFVLGVGVGWNAEELADHRPELPFKLRYSALKERVAALRAMWTDSEAGFEGRWDRMSPSWVYPKPTRGTVPIALGNWGPLGIRHAAEYADHWMPIDAWLAGEDGKPDVAAGVELFRRLVAECGRDPDTVPISLVMFSRPTAKRIERYAALGIERVACTAPSAGLIDTEFTLRDLDAITPLVEQYRTV